MTVDGLLSAEECRLLIANAEVHLTRSRTVDPDTGLPMEQEIRTSSDASFDAIQEDLALRCVQLRMASRYICRGAINAILPVNQGLHHLFIQVLPRAS